MLHLKVHILYIYLHFQMKSPFRVFVPIFYSSFLVYLRFGSVSLAKWCGEVRKEVAIAMEKHAIFHIYQKHGIHFKIEIK